MDIGTLTGYIILEDSLSPALETASRNLQSFGKDAKNAGMALSTAISLPLAAVAGFAAKAAIDFESSFAGVRKTVDASEAQFSALQASFRGLAKEIPISVNQLDAIAEAGGQLGVKTEDIVLFTRTMADMGIATNLSSDQAATSLAQIANIINNEAGPQYDKLGATIVDLGNKSAATESDITEFGLRLAGAGHQIGLTEPEILGIGSALASVGLSAEAGGTAFSKTMIQLAVAADKGGAKLENLAAVAGMSATEFKHKFETDAAGALVKFVEGLGKVESKGGSLFTVMENLGITEQRMRDALLRTAGAGDMLAKSIDDGRAAWEANNALTVEAEKRYATTASQMQLLWNKVTDVGITLGDTLLPSIIGLINALDPLIKMLADTAKWFAELPAPVRYVTIGFLAIVAAIGPMLIGLGLMATGWAAIIPLFAAGTIGGSALSGALWLVNSALIPLATTLAPFILALGALWYAVNQLIPAFHGLAQAWAEGKTWEFLSARDEDNFVRRWLGMSTGVKTAKDGVLPDIKAINDAIVGLANQRTSVSPDLSQMESALKKASDAGELTSPIIEDVGNAMKRAGLHATAATPYLFAVSNAFAAITAQAKPVVKAVTESEDANTKAAHAAEEMKRQLEVLRKDALQPLTAAQKAYITEAKKLGDEESNIAKITGVNERAIRAYLDAQKEAIKKADEHAKAVGKMTSAMEGTNKQLRDMPNSVRWVIEAQLKAGQSAKDIGDAYGYTEETIKEVADQMKMLTDLHAFEASALGVTETSLGKVTRAEEEYIKLLGQNVTMYATLSPAHQKEIDFYRTQTTATEKQIAAAIDRLRVLELLGRVENANNAGLVSALTSIGEKVNVYDTLTAGQQEYARQVKNTTDLVDGWASALSAVGGAFPDSTFGKSIAGIGQAFTNASASQKAAERVAARYNQTRGVNPPAGADWGYGSVLFGQGATRGERAQAAGQIGQAAISGYYGMRSALDQPTLGGRTMAAAQTGSQVGSAFGPYGALIGMGVGAMIGAMSKDPQWAVAASTISHEMGITITEDLARSIASSGEELGGNWARGFYVHMGEVIQQAGGLTEESYAAMVPRLNGMLNEVANGTFEATAAAESLNDTWTEFARVGTSDIGVLDREMVHVIEEMQRLGVESQAVTAYLGAQGVAGASAFGDFVTVGAGAITEQQRLKEELAQANADLADADSEEKEKILQNIESINAALLVQQGIQAATAITSQESADALAAGVAADFDAMLNSGMSFHDAVEAIQPAIEGLQIQMEAAGLSGSDVFDVLQEQVALYSDAIAGPALSAVDSLSSGMVNLSNMGQLNQTSFAALSGQIGSTFQSLVAQGNNSDVVMIGMRDSIQRMWEEQQEFGFHTDEATQALIDEAVAQGIVGEKHKSVSDQMLDATNRMVVALEAVAKTMGADIPNAASNAAYTTRGAADSMVHDWDRVHDAATGAAEGHSPSGIKQITVRTIEAQAAVELAANQMIAAFGQIFLVVTGLGDAVMDTFESVHQQIEDYRNVDTVIRSLTAAQKSFIEVALVSGVSIADIAALLGTSTIAIQSYVDANKKAAAAVTATAAATAQHAQVMADINKAIADHNSAAADMARLTAEQRTFIDSAVAAGVSVSTLAGALGTTVDAIQLYVDAQKAAADATTAAATAAAKHVQVIDDINKAIADHDGAAAALAQLTGDQQLFIGRALEAGVSVSALAEAFGTTVDAINLYVEAQKAAADASKATEKAATDAAAAAAKEAQKITDINTAISQHKGAADEAAKFTQDQRTFINDAIAAGVSVAALADVMDTTTYAIQYFVDAQKALTQGGAQTQTPPLTGSEAFEQWRQGYSQSVASPVEYYATGADVIPFPSRGTDTVPAMLTPGEGVLTVEQNKEYHQTVEGPSNQEVVDAVNGLRTDMTVKMPRALARALHTGLVGLRTAS